MDLVKRMQYICFANSFVNKYLLHFDYQQQQLIILKTIVDSSHAIRTRTLFSYVLSGFFAYSFLNRFIY